MFVWMEGLASVIVVQATGRTGRVLAERSEEWQVGLLVGAASAYVASATWIVWVRLPRKSFHSGLARATPYLLLSAPFDSATPQ